MLDREHRETEYTRTYGSWYASDKLGEVPREIIFLFSDYIVKRVLFSYVIDRVTMKPRRRRQPLADPVPRKTLLVPYGLTKNNGISVVFERLVDVSGWMLALILCTLSLIQERFRESRGGFAGGAHLNAIDVHHIASESLHPHSSLFLELWMIMTSLLSCFALIRKETRSRPEFQSES